MQAIAVTHELGIDPETLKPIPSSDYSDAMYYAVECQDYAYYLGAGDETARLKAWVADATSAGVEKLRLGSTFYGDIPCLWWPAQPASDPRTPALTDTPYPIFVLTATLDPATPFVDAMRIYGRASDPYMFVQVGGPHVIFGRGLDCPDVAVTDFLAKGTLPATRITVCDGAVADPYVANPKPAAADYRTALQFMSAMDDEINNTDDYNYRFDTDPITLGCDAGGTLTYRPDGAQARQVRLHQGSGDDRRRTDQRRRIIPPERDCRRWAGQLQAGRQRQAHGEWHVPGRRRALTGSSRAARIDAAGTGAAGTHSAAASDGPKLETAPGSTAFGAPI